MDYKKITRRCPKGDGKSLCGNSKYWRAMKALDMKYAFSVLNALLDAEQLMKSDLFSIVRNNNTLDKLIDALQMEDIISVEEKMLGRRTYAISLTQKGGSIATYLKLAEKASLQAHTPPGKVEKSRRRTGK